MRGFRTAERDRMEAPTARRARSSPRRGGRAPSGGPDGADPPRQETVDVRSPTALRFAHEAGARPAGSRRDVRADRAARASARREAHGTLMPTFLTFATSQTVTSAFQIDRSHRALACFVGSYGTAAAVTVQYATLSGTGPFLPLFRADGSGQPFTVCSGVGGGVAV